MTFEEKPQQMWGEGVWIEDRSGLGWMVDRLYL